MRYTYISDSKPEIVTKREAWVFQLFDDSAQSRESARERAMYQAIYNEVKLNMVGSYINNPNHKYHKYLQDLIRKGLIKKDLLRYVLVSCVSKDFFSQMFPGSVSDNSITLGCAFPWLYDGTAKKTGATAVHQIFFWDIMDWIEKVNKWYYKLFFWKKYYIPLYPEITMKGLIYHELIHARQYIVEHKREPAVKDGKRSYRNHLEKEAYSLQMQMEDAEIGHPYHLERWNAKTYEEAADNYLKYLTSDEE